MVLGEMRVLNKSWEKLMSGNCCVMIVYGCIQTDGVDNLLQSVRLHQNGEVYMFLHSAYMPELHTLKQL